NSSLTELNLGANQIGAGGAQALATALQTNKTLRELNLGYNQIGAAGVQALASALQTNSSLRELLLFNNQIGDDGAQAIANALEHNTSLTILSLGINQIEDEGVTAAIDNALLKNKNTKELKSTILHKAMAIAKISPELAPKDQKGLAGRLGSMPDEVIAKITEFKEASIEPHNLTTDQRLKLRLSAIEHARLSEYKVFENKSLKQIIHNQSPTDLYNSSDSKYDIRIAKQVDNSSWEHQAIIEQIAKNLNAAFEAIEGKYDISDKKEFIRDVIEFTQRHEGVGNASEHQSEMENFVAAKEFSYQYQKISKESGVYTGRSENFREVGARLKRIPPELTADILTIVQESSISVKML
ncbi:hypothetical protein OAP83_02100, partial [Rickettsiales bacterium]|nr:hypothetical protein [Rickettsiales bacterium]